MSTIFVYHDEGVGASYKALLRSLKLSAHCAPYSIEMIDAKTLLKGEWQANCKLLIIPGGSDTPYHKLLQGKGANLIREYVQNGGSFLGICAGAYFSSKKVVFEEGKEHEVIADRELHFFPGSAIGAIYTEKKFSYQAHESAHVATIEMGNKSFSTYYNGGCYFEKAEEHSPHIEIIARYKDAEVENAPAVILSHVGKGIAILSGVHCEISASYCKLQKELFQKLYPSDIKRKEFFDLLLSVLLI